ncbi:MAG: DUF3267 domain-containing protein [Acutalibacteraceae bacterium]
MKKYAHESLPCGYKEILCVNLAKDKKLAVWLNIGSLLIAAAMTIPMHFHVSIFTLFDISDGLYPYLARFAVLLIGMFIYIFLHEAVHGITMKLFGCKKVKYGFKVVYAYAGSEEYFEKKSYVVIALAPVVLWGALLAVINAFVPESWFWVVYFIQMLNISGAVGDFYVTAKFSKLPKDILIKDTGTQMSVFAQGE